jgi:hypothetical protein
MPFEADPPVMASLSLTQPVTIRPAYPEDELALRRLADLDSARVPSGPLMLAEVDGELRAAVSVDGRTAIADPFHRTLELVTLVRDFMTRPIQTRKRL